MHSPTNQIKAFTNQEARNVQLMYHTVFHSFSLFPNCLRFLDNLCVIDLIRFEHLDHVIKTDQSESVNFVSFIGSKKKKQIPDFSLSDWPVSGHMIFFFCFKKKFFILHFSYVFPHFSPPLLYPSTPLSPLHPCVLVLALLLHVLCLQLSFTQCALNLLAIFFASIVFSLSFTSCPLSLLALFCLYTVHLL